MKMRSKTDRKKMCIRDSYKGDLKVTKQTLNKEDLLKKIDLKGTTNGIYGVKNGADELEKVWVNGCQEGAFLSLTFDN